MGFMDKDSAQAFSAAVGAELRGYRAGAPMTMDALSEATGISKSKIIRMESARVDSGTKDIAIIAAVLGFDPAELMRRARQRLESGQV